MRVVLLMTEEVSIQQSRPLPGILPGWRKITLLLSYFDKLKGLHLLQLHRSYHYHEPWQNSLGFSCTNNLLTCTNWLEYLNYRYFLGNWGCTNKLSVRIIANCMVYLVSSEINPYSKVAVMITSICPHIYWCWNNNFYDMIRKNKLAKNGGIYFHGLP